jgi:glycosyltransferase involved in cell wall biosynthesis
MMYGGGGERGATAAEVRSTLKLDIDPYAGSTRPRILYVLSYYPSIACYSFESEINAVKDRFDVMVLVTERDKPGSRAYYADHSPFVVITDEDEMCAFIADFKPVAMHTQRLFTLPLVLRLARRTAVPFTVRAHSHDSIPSADPRVASWMALAPRFLPEATSSELCLGILCLPFTRPFLEAWGIPSAKLIDCYPPIDFARFHDPSPNGRGALNTGSYMPKKDLESFLELAKLVPELSFGVYPLPYHGANPENLRQRARELGSPVRVLDPVQPWDMPREYKQYNWLVYSCDPVLQNVGWPISVPEAQAAGVGVLMRNIRPDVREFVGPGGFVYDTLEEAAEIIRRPFPDELRQLGFEQARKSDVFVHRTLLTELWDRVLPPAARRPAEPRPPRDPRGDAQPRHPG